MIYINMDVITHLKDSTSALNCQQKLGKELHRLPSLHLRYFVEVKAPRAQNLSFTSLSRYSSWEVFIVPPFIKDDYTGKGSLDTV